MTAEHLNIDHMSMVFDTPAGPFKALDNVNLVIARGEYVSLIGHSGCGKSTVLNVVAGLHRATSGGVVLDGTEVDEPGPDRAVEVSAVVEHVRHAGDRASVGGFLGLVVALVGLLLGLFNWIGELRKAR